MAAEVISPNSAFINGPLTTFASKYANSQFVGDRLVKPFLVDQIGATFKKRLRVDEATLVDDAIGPDSRLNEVKYQVEDDLYLCRPRGLAHPSSKLTQAVSNSALDPKQVGVANLMQHIALLREDRIAQLIMSSANWSANNRLAITNSWDNETAGKPVTDMKTGLQAIPFNGEDVEVYGVCSDVVWDKVSMHPQVMSLRSNGGTEGGPAKASELASYLGIADILVSKVHKNTATPGLTESYSRVWGTDSFAFVVVPREVVSTEQMMFGANFMFNLEGGVNGIRVREWFDPGRGQGGTDMTAVELSDHAKVIQNDAGFLFTSVL